MTGVVTVSPAPLMAAREIYARSAGAKPILGRAAALQLAVADTFGLLVEERLLVVLGFWRHTAEPPHDVELFMACAAPELVRPHAVRLVAAGRLIVSRMAQDATVGRLFARVASLEGSGRRLARAVGLRVSSRLVSAPPGSFLEVTAGMDFSDALKHVKAGKVAWRDAWSPREREVRDGGKCLVLRYEGGPARGGGETVYFPTQEDLFADDWTSSVERRG